MWGVGNAYGVAMASVGDQLTPYSDLVTLRLVLPLMPARELGQLEFVDSLSGERVQGFRAGWMRLSLPGLR
jgi:hypothetical protein